MLTSYVWRLSTLIVLKWLQFPVTRVLRNDQLQTADGQPVRAK
jgi:hypothetical protein